MNKLLNLYNWFKQNRRLTFVFIILSILTSTALFVPIICNNKPIIASQHGEISFPAVKDLLYNDSFIDNDNWKIKKYDFAIWPICRYTNTELDLNNSNYRSPFDTQNINNINERHWLGTDQLGRDVLAGIIYGSRIALIVGCFSMLVSLLIGVTLGSISGYWADDKIKVNLFELLLLIPIPFLIYFYSFYLLKYKWIAMLSNFNIASFKTILQSILSFATIILIYFTIIFIERRILKNKLKTRFYLPVDFIISRGIEVFESLPLMFLIIALMAIIKPSLFYVVIIIGLTSWTSIARYVRNEFLRIRKLEYIEAAHALGYNSLRIIFNHALPNALNPILIALSFGVAGAIMAESTLSFLGIGLSSDQVTWGSLLAGARQSPEAWWLVIFPGIMIFITIVSLNTLGDELAKKIDSRLK